jgi:hypothetical protein
MSVLVQIGRRKAIFRAGTWRSSALERRLNNATEAWIQATGGPPLRHQDPEQCAAAEIVRRLGGEVKLHVPADHRTKRLFVSRRQMRFDF